MSTSKNWLLGWCYLSSKVHWLFVKSNAGYFSKWYIVTCQSLVSSSHLIFYKTAIYLRLSRLHYRFQTSSKLPPNTKSYDSSFRLYNIKLLIFLLQSYKWSYLSVSVRDISRNGDSLPLSETSVRMLVYCLINHNNLEDLLHQNPG